jgi:oligopeptide transport system substrate-binding protein
VGLQAHSRRLRAVLLAAVGLIAAASCSRAPESGHSADAHSSSAILLRGNGPEPDSLDPQRARSVEAHNVLRDLCECLTALAPDASVIPGAAGGWKVSTDGRTYTFALRPELRWSNGDAVVANDFVAGLRRLVDPATASPYAQIIDVISNAGDIIAGKRSVDQLGVSAPDDRTVIIQLTAPAPYLPGLVSHPSTCPVHRPTLAGQGTAYAKPGTMVSNGAFVLKDWVHGSHIVLERNPRYWNNAATRLDGVRYLHIVDDASELMRYRAGELHITYAVPRSQLDWIRQNLDRELHIATQLSTYFYGFNLRRAPFKDRPKLRAALSMVVDRERLIQSVLRAGEVAAYGWVPPGVNDYTTQSFDYRETPLPERIETARRLYAEEGYSAKNPLSFELRYNAGEAHNNIAVAVASMWKEALGVQVSLAAVEFKSLLEDIDRGDVEVFRSSWMGDYNDAYAFAQYMKSDFGINLPRFRNPEYDALLTQAASEAEASRRKALLEQAERVMLREHPIVPLYFYVTKHLVKPEVQGWYNNVMNVVYSKDLWLSTSR